MRAVKAELRVDVEAEISVIVLEHGGNELRGEALSRLAQQRATADAVEGRCLLAALRAAAHVHLGFGSFGEYIGRLFGYGPRSTQEKLRVAEALEGLPGIAAALEHGSLNWSAVRELTRVAVAETEREWLEVARGKTVHQLEALVAGKIPGDRPSAPVRPDARRHVLRFEVAPETLCLFREAMSKLRRASGELSTLRGTRQDDESVVNPLAVFAQSPALSLLCQAKLAARQPPEPRPS